MMWPLKPECDPIDPPPPRIDFDHLDEDDWQAWVNLDVIAPRLALDEPRWARTCSADVVARAPGPTWVEQRRQTLARLEPRPSRVVIADLPQYVTAPRREPPAPAAAPLPPDPQQIERAHELLRWQFGQARHAMLLAGMDEQAIRALAHDMGLTE